MPDVNSKFFGGTDLGRLGLITPEVGGVFDLPDVEMSRAFVPGSDAPSDYELRGALVPMRWRCVVAGDSHEHLIQRLTVLRGYLSPHIGWKYLEVPNRPGQRTLARCKGFPFSFDHLPYQSDVAQFDLSWERLPYWEDSQPNIQEITAKTGTITNTGQLDAYPMWQIERKSSIGSIWFENTTRAERFIWAKVLATHLFVLTDVPDVRLTTAAGTRDFSGVSVSGDWPALSVGVNAIAKSLTTAYFDLWCTWRRRYL